MLGFIWKLITRRKEEEPQLNTEGATARAFEDSLRSTILLASLCMQARGCSLVYGMCLVFQKVCIFVSSEVAVVY